MPFSRSRTSFDHISFIYFIIFVCFFSSEACVLIWTLARYASLLYFLPFCFILSMLLFVPIIQRSSNFVDICLLACCLQAQIFVFVSIVGIAQTRKSRIIFNDFIPRQVVFFAFLATFFFSQQVDYEFIS